MSVGFESRPIAFADALAQLVGWSGQHLHVEVLVAGSAGVCGFDGRFEGVAADENKGSVVLWFEGDVAFVVLNEVMSAFTVSSTAMAVRWIRFTVGEHQSIEVERLVPEEIRRRVEGAGLDA